MDDRRGRDLLDAARMKTVEMFRDFDFPLHPRRSVRFVAGTTYSRVLELAAREIERHGAGRIVELDKPGDATVIISTDEPLTAAQADEIRRRWNANYVDASHAFKRKR
jgi:phosphate uptake regulator